MAYQREGAAAACAQAATISCCARTSTCLLSPASLHSSAQSSGRCAEPCSYVGTIKMDCSDGTSGSISSQPGYNSADWVVSPEMPRGALPCTRRLAVGLVLLQHC